MLPYWVFQQTWAQPRLGVPFDTLEFEQQNYVQSIGELASPVKLISPSNTKPERCLQPDA